MRCPDFSTSVALAMATMYLTSCGAAETFEEQSTDIVAAEGYGMTIGIKAEQEVLSRDLALSQLGMLIGEIAEGVQAELPGISDETEWVHLQLAYATQDRLGNAGNIDAGTFTLPVDDLRNANVTNLSGEQWLALVSSISAGPGIDILVEQCSDPSIFVSNQSFCPALVAAVA